MSTQSTSPVAVLGLSTAERIALGGSHACAILTGGSVECWGSNSHGQLGDGTINSRLTPVPVLDIKMATSLALGEYNSCAALTGGTIQCWGANDRGQLGNGTLVSSSVPVFVSTGGSLQCWGANTYGQLGDGTITSGSSVPVSVSNITTATSIAVGAYHTCAVLTSATIKCWGRGNFGQLGNGTKESSASLVSCMVLQRLLALQPVDIILVPCLWAGQSNVGAIIMVAGSEMVPKQTEQAPLQLIASRLIF